MSVSVIGSSHPSPLQFCLLHPETGGRDTFPPVGCLFMCSGSTGGNRQFTGLLGVTKQIKDLWEMVTTSLNSDPNALQLSPSGGV